MMRHGLPSTFNLAERVGVGKEVIDNIGANHADCGVLSLLDFVVKAPLSHVDSLNRDHTRGEAANLHTAAHGAMESDAAHDVGLRAHGYALAAIFADGLVVSVLNTLPLRRFDEVVDV
jgi:hypothetical protein